MIITVKSVLISEENIEKYTFLFYSKNVSKSAVFNTSQWQYGTVGKCTSRRSNEFVCRLFLAAIQKSAQHGENFQMALCHLLKFKFFSNDSATRNMSAECDSTLVREAKVLHQVDSGRKGSGIGTIR